jgi:hypothetical protein
VGDGSGEGVVRMVPDGSRGRFIGGIVLAAKAVFGTPTDDLANRLVIRKFLRDLMEERGMRPTHIMRFLDLCVELVFIPSNVEVQTKRMRMSRAWTGRRREYRRAGGLWLNRTLWEFLTGTGEGLGSPGG